MIGLRLSGHAGYWMLIPSTYGACPNFILVKKTGYRKRRTEIPNLPTPKYEWYFKLLKVRAG